MEQQPPGQDFVWVLLLFVLFCSEVGGEGRHAFVFVKASEALRVAMQISGVPRQAMAWPAGPHSCVGTGAGMAPAAWGLDRPHSSRCPQPAPRACAGPDRHLNF